MTVRRAGCRLGRYDVLFYIDSADPTKNMIVWFLLIEDENHIIDAAVDDEKGMLLALNCNLNKQAYKNGMSALPKPAAEKNVIKPSPGEAADGSTIAELIGQTRRLLRAGVCRLGAAGQRVLHPIRLRAHRRTRERRYVRHVQLRRFLCEQLSHPRRGTQVRLYNNSPIWYNQENVSRRHKWLQNR